MTVSARFVTIYLLLAAAFIAVLSLLAAAVDALITSVLPFSFEIERMLRLGREASLSAWFGASVFLACALLFWLAARNREAPQRRSFGAFAIVSLLLSVDLATNAHERLLAWWRTTFGHDQWWLVAAALLVALGLIFAASRRWHPQSRLMFRCSWLLIIAGYLWKTMLSFGFGTSEAVFSLLVLFGGIALLHTCLLYFADQLSPLNLQFSSGRQALLWSVGITVFFTLATILLHVLTQRDDILYYDPFQFINLFNTGQEATIPTLFSQALMLLSALLLWLIAVGRSRDNARFVRHWRGLAVLFVLLSLDEAVSLHEQLMQPSRALLSKLSLETNGLLYFAWIVPAGFLLLLLIILYIPFLRHLPRRTFWLFFLSAALFVGGAIGFEIPGGYFTTRFGNENSIKLALETVEELCEFLGVAVFLYALLDYLKTNVGTLTVFFVRGRKAAADAAL